MNQINDFIESQNISIGHILIFTIACFVIMFVCMLISFIMLANIKKKYKIFMSGKDGVSLEELINEKLKKITDFDDQVDELNDSLKNMQETLDTAIQKVGIVKYNAFEDTGGKLSFALALLSAENNGIVINSMHNREGCYTYAKEIIRGESFVALSSEEKKAIDEAKKSCDFMEKAV